MKRDLAGVGAQWRTRARHRGGGGGETDGGVGSETELVTMNKKKNRRPVSIPASPMDKEENNIICMSHCT